jgi:hypothetical protein
MENQEKFFVTRHSKKPKGEDIESSDYPGISEKGVELAKERAQEIESFLEQQDTGTVMFIGGGSEIARTKSTAEAYGDAVKELSKEKKDILVITKDEIISEGAPTGYTKAIEKIVEKIKLNPDKKVVVDYPLFLKELSPARWFDEKGNLSPYAAELLKRNNDDEYETTKDWIRTGGQIENLQGPNPSTVAEGYKKALLRLQEFAKQFIGDRSLVVGVVGHSMDIDVFATQLAKGKIDVQGFEEVTRGQLVKETEMATIKMDKDKITLSYRNQDFTFENQDNEPNKPNN